MSALRNGPRGMNRQRQGGGGGPLSRIPEGFELSDQQMNRYENVLANRGRRGARKFLNRLEREGKLQEIGAPGENGGNEALGLQDVENTVYSGVNNLVDRLNTRPDFAPEGLPDIPGVEGGFGQERQNATNAVYDEFSRRNEPLFQQQQQAFRQRMAEQGIPEGSEQFQRAQQQMLQSQNDARLSAQNQAFLTGGQEQSRLFGLASGARGQLFNEQQNMYRMPLETLAAYSPYFQTGAAGDRLQQQFNYQDAAREDTQAFTDQQAKQQQEFALEQIRNTPRGGAQIMPFDEWARRQDYAANIQQNQLFDEMVIRGGGVNQMPQPGFGGGFAGGFGAGVGAGILR